MSEAIDQLSRAGENSRAIGGHRSPGEWHSQLGGRIRFAHLAIAVGFAFSSLAVVYSLVIPPWEAPDENPHVRYAAFLIEEGRLPGPDEEVMAHYPPLYYLLALPLLAPFSSELDRPISQNREHRWADPNAGGHYVFLHNWAAEDFPYGDQIRALHLARLLSVLSGAVAVVGALYLGKELLGRQAPAVAVAVTTAFMPSFLFTCATFHPDSLVTAFGALVLWRGVTFLQGPTLGNISIVGVLTGLMTLAKVTGIVFVALIPLAVALSGTAPRTKLRLLTAGTGCFCALAGPWLARNSLLFGDPLAWGAFIQNYPPGGTPLEPLSVLSELAKEWTPDSLLWHSLILAFGYLDEYAPPALYSAAYVVGICAVGGLAASAIRHGREVRSWGPLTIFLGTGCAGMALAAAQFGTTFPTGAHGRYVFPVLPVIATGLVVGLRGLLPSRLSGLILVLPAALLGLSVATPFLLIRPTYSLAGKLDTAAEASLRPNIEAMFDGRIALLRAEVEPERAEPPGFVRVRLWWRALEDIGRSYRIFVQLLGHDGRAVTQLDRSPRSGSGSTDLWRKGDVVTDEALLPLDDRIPVGQYSVATGFYRLEDLERLKATGPASGPGNVALLGKVRVLEPAPDVLAAPLANFGNELALVEEASSPVAERGATYAVGVTWLAAARPLRDYTVSVQILDERGTLIAQADAPPLGGALPTTSWAAGDVVRDRYLLQIPHDAPPQVRLLLVVYDPLDGARLPVGSGDALELRAISIDGT